MSGKTKRSSGKSSSVSASKKAASRKRLGADAIAAAQGIKPIEDFDKFLNDVSDFWPEDENCDEFLAWLRKGRRDGCY